MSGVKLNRFIIVGNKIIINEINAKLIYLEHKDTFLENVKNIFGRKTFKYLIESELPFYEIKHKVLPNLCYDCENGCERFFKNYTPYITNCGYYTEI